MNLEDILLRNRETSSRYHLEIARSWRLIGEQDKLHSPLAYAAFEFRCSIERLVFELFYLVKEEQLNKKDLKAVERFSSLLKTLDASQGGRKNLERRMTFNRILSQANKAPMSQWIPFFRLGKLQTFWHDLSEYCHRQLKPKTTWSALGNPWVSKGYKLLNEVETYLWPIIVESHLGWFAEDITMPEVLQARNDYISGAINEKTVETKLALMTPVLEKRFRQRHRRK